MPRLEDLTGRKFGSWTVVEFAGWVLSGGARVYKWKCLCNCGTIRSVSKSSLIRGQSLSCGCGEKPKIHGRSKDNYYHAFRGMIRRCYNPNSDNYQFYGAKGVKVCDRWMESKGKGFLNFLEDMGERPDGYSLDRRDNALDYCKENCRWIPKAMQGRNQTKKKSNKTGVNGVTFNTVSNVYVAHWRSLKGRSHTKSFSPNKYGEELAFFMACEYRDHQIMLLNLQGASYTYISRQTYCFCHCPPYLQL